MDSNALILWVGGICATGFFFLAGWCMSLSMKYNAISGTAEKVAEIHLALMGDMQNEGQISRVRRIEEKCKLRHTDK